MLPKKSDTLTLMELHLPLGSSLFVSLISIRDCSAIVHLTLGKTFDYNYLIVVFALTAVSLFLVVNE